MAARLRLWLAVVLMLAGAIDAAQLASPRVSSRAKSVRRGGGDARSSSGARTCHHGVIARRLLITSTRKASSKTSMFDIYDKLVMSTP